MSDLIAGDSYKNMEGLKRNIYKLIEHGRPWARGMRPHIRRLFTDWRVLHNYVNVLTEAARTQPGGDYDAAYVYSHLVGVPVTVALILMAVL